MDPVAVAPFGFIDIDMGTPYPESMPGYLIIGPVQILIGFDSVTGKITKPEFSLYQKILLKIIHHHEDDFHEF